MKTAYRSLVLFFALLLFAASLRSGSPGPSRPEGKWFTTYYPTWAMNPLGSLEYALPPWEIEWSGLTHLILFDNGNVTQTAPYWAYMFGPPPMRPLDTESDSVAVEFNGIAAPGDGVWPHYLDSLIAIAHRHGVKVLATIQAVDPTNLNFVAEDSLRTELFTNTVGAWAERKKFDGIELDWEGWAAPLPPRQTVNRFVRMLYRRIHAMKTATGAPGVITISAGSGQQRLYDPRQDSLVDQFNLQLYDYSYAWYGKLEANASWYLAPLHRGQVDSTFEGEAYDTRGPLQWVAAGHDPARLGIGVPIFGSILRNVDSLFQKMEADGDYGIAHYQVIEELKTIGGREEWDDVRKVRSIRGRAVRGNGREVYYQSDGVAPGQKFFATGETPRSLKEKIDWMILSGFGGVMTYDLVSDLDSGEPIESARRHPLKHAIASLLAPAAVPDSAGNVVCVHEARAFLRKDETRLEQNYPNPFNPKTRLPFTLTARANVTLTIYDILGRVVAIAAEGEFTAGRHMVEWDASRMPGGVYLCRLTVGAYSETRVMTLLK